MRATVTVLVAIVTISAGPWTARADRDPQPLRTAARAPRPQLHQDPNRDFNAERQIQTAVEDELARDSRITSDAVVPFVMGDEVFLLGWVRSRAELRAAGQAASRAMGVGQVTNRLRIRGWASAVDPAERARRALEEDDQLGALELKVQVAGHTALVTGTVPSAKLRRRAVRLLARVRGIRRVDDELVLRPGRSAPHADRTSP